MKKNRFLVFLLALVVVIVAVALVLVIPSVMPGSKDEGEPERFTCESYTYILLKDGTAEIVECSQFLEAANEVLIPDQLDGYAVSSVAGGTFNANFNKIVRFAVSSDNPYLAVIDGVLFSKADKRLIAYPQGNGETSYSIPQGIQIIGEYAFYGCSSLQSITLPDSVTSIGVNPFSICNNLSEIIVSPNHPCLETRDGLLIYKNGEESRLVTYPYTFTATEFTIPEGITSIGDSAFYGCDSLQSIAIPDSVTSIGDSAFYGCVSLQSITIPDSVTSIGDSAFSYCGSLQSITIPDSVTSIGANPFSGCDNLSEIIVSPNHPCLEMKNDLLIYKSKKETRLITCPCDVKATEVTVPEGVTSIGDNAFAGCYSLERITIPDSVTSIGSYAFFWCDSLQSITIPDSVTSIGSYAFDWCGSLQSITIPDSVTSIDDGTFVDCNSLQSITIPDSVTSIGDSAFAGCNSLQSITIPASVTTIGEEAFYKCPKSLTLTVIQGSYAETYAIDNGLTYIYPDTNDWLLD